MASCCGRQFGSEAAFSQHQKDKHGLESTTPTTQETRPSRSSKGNYRREAWMWKGVKNNNAISIIDPTNLEPSAARVLSTSADELICSYNWQNTKEALIQIPGHAPIWQRVPLPVTLPGDKETYFVDQNASRIPQYPFEPLFRATASMSPEFCFDGVDIVVNRNSLRKLLDFCNGRVKSSFRLNLLLVKNTLFIERCERNAVKMIRGSQNSGWGRNFEKTFTKYPPEANDSSGHHRILRYPLGHLNCAVRFEVDACYEPEMAESLDELLEATPAVMGKLSVADSADDAEPTTGCQARSMPQSTAAELKTRSKFSGTGSHMPQLWFGRTPWLIVARHTNGTFEEIRIHHAAAQFAEWEDKNQTALRKLVTVLTRLGEVVKTKGGNCVAICDKGSASPVIKVFGSTTNKQALPRDLIRKFWSSPDGTTIRV